MLPPNIPEPDLQGVLDAISKIKALDLRTVTIEDILELLKPFFDGYSHATTNYHAGLHIYRTSVSHKATKVSQLAYPPASLTKIGRANREGKSVFYGCSDKIGAIIERRLSKGDKFTLSEWITTDKLLVNHVGFVDEILQKHGSKRPPEQLARFKANGKVSELIAEFLSGVFTETVGIDETHKYKLSNAIAEQLLLPIESDIGLKFSGLLYPSVAMSSTADNLALDTQYVDSCMKVIKAEFWEVVNVRLNKDNAPSYDWAILDVASSFSKDGAIKWMEIS
jgi:hypothetical protein